MTVILQSSRSARNEMVDEASQRPSAPSLLGSDIQTQPKWFRHASLRKSRSAHDDATVCEAPQLPLASTPPRSDHTPIQSKLYEYVPLRKPRSIRLLEIFPGTEPTAIHCRIQEVSLDDPPSYHAVSYVWGSSKLEKRIRIGSSVLMVTNNCYRVLSSLRKKNLPRFCWIDACCIDQASMDERSLQVGMMGDVYSMATRTIVWLGDADLDSKHDDAGAIRFIKEFAHGSTQDEYHTVEEKKQYIKAFMDKPWFHRVWTVQEFALSKKCLIMCGKTWLEAQDLMKFLDYKQNKNQVLSKFHRVRLHQQMWKDVHARQAAHNKSAPSRDDTAHHAETKSLASCSALLIATRPQSSTNPRDKIFAFRGILEILDIQLPRPNYLSPVRQVYREAAAAAIKHDRSLMLLSSLTGTSMTTSLPSWVPDWSNNNFITEIASWDTASAAGKTPAWYTISDDCKSLTLKGTIIDEITFSSHAYPAVRDLEHAADQDVRHSARRKEVAVLKTWFAAFEEIHGVNMDAFFSKLAKEAWNQTRQRGDVGTDVLAHWWIKVIKCVGLDASAVKTIPNHMLKILLGSGLDWPTKNGIRSAMVPFHKMMRELLDRKKMFKSPQGRLGMGCQSLRSGDKIALFSGCNLPMVISEAKDGDAWRFICPAYFEGAMHNSKAWSSAKSYDKFTFI
ncbi:hypothetical protein HBH69_075160 [Parastagonospora nodorum]|nr:hypothetical protein HBH69_075160 [Parastagonospora nodorum]KAH6067519.1 hypothetical protein HBI66_148390 [Parastagonospora nodorum]KAH6072104.1 hypothetical protein HBI67_085450 [Parastagonospora nodorum]